MFIGLGKMLGKSKIRLGVGFRLTKSNAFYMFLMCWYCCVLCFWMIYAVGYGFYALIRWIVRKIKGNR